MVLYDNLVSKDVLALVPAGAEMIYVGKVASHHTLAQESIIDLMVRLAQAGHDLVRLKGGDGYIFGRGGEEAQVLAEQDIPFEVVPGITAAQGAGACAGIPLTHRDYSATLVLATGHLRGANEVALDWQALSRPRRNGGDLHGHWHLAHHLPRVAGPWFAGRYAGRVGRKSQPARAALRDRHRREPAATGQR